MANRSWNPVVLAAAGLMMMAAGRVGAAPDAQTLPFAALTVPESGLPGGCRAEPVVTQEARISPDGRVMLDGRTGGFSTNPWQGTDRRPLLAVRQRMYPSPRVPDGAPLDRAEAARFDEQSLVDVVEGYRAFYRSGDDTIEVMAIRFTDPQRAADHEPAIGSFPTDQLTRRVIGPVAVLARSTAKQPTACARAIHDHIRRLKL